MIDLKQRLKNSSLYCFTPGKLARGRDIIDIVQQQIRGGCDIIQLREKKLPDREKLRLALIIRKITRDKNVIFIVNDDVDIAFFSNADGIHLGDDDIPVEYARKILKNKIVGVSTCSLKQFKQAQDMNVDYVAIQPVFRTATKEDAGSPISPRQLPGILKYKKKLTAVIGGIDLNNLNLLYGLKIDLFAIISGIINAVSIEEQTRQIKEKIKNLKAGC